MPATRIFGPTRIHSKGQADWYRMYVLDILSGGSKAKTAQYSIVCKMRSSANAYVKLELEHSLDGHNFTMHSSPIAYAAAPDGGALMGDADTSDILGEHRRCLLYIKDNTSTAEEWAIVEVWEMLKPF